MGRSYREPSAVRGRERHRLRTDLNRKERAGLAKGAEKEQLRASGYDLEIEGERRSGTLRAES
jgi:hypothetical protein